TLRLSATLLADPARSPVAALAQLDAAIESLPRLGDPAEIVRIAGAAACTDRLPGCRQALRRGAGGELDSGAVTSAIHATILLAVEAYQSGQWEEARRLAESATESCDARGYRLLRWDAHTVRALLAAGRGEAGVARALADEMVAWAAPR